MKEGVYYNGFLIQLEIIKYNYNARASIYKILSLPADKEYKNGEKVRIEQEDIEEECLVNINIWNKYYLPQFSNDLQFYYDLNEVQELTEAIKYTVEAALKIGNIEKL